MRWRRTLLAVALVGGCVWCLGLVQQVHSQDRAGPGPGKPGGKVVTPANALGGSGGVSFQPGKGTDNNP